MQNDMMQNVMGKPATIDKGLRVLGAMSNVVVRKLTVPVFKKMISYNDATSWDGGKKEEGKYMWARGPAIFKTIPELCGNAATVDMGETLTERVSRASAKDKPAIMMGYGVVSNASGKPVVRAVAAATYYKVAPGVHDGVDQLPYLDPDTGKLEMFFRGKDRSKYFVIDSVCALGKQGRATVLVMRIMQEAAKAQKDGIVVMVTKESERMFQNLQFTLKEPRTQQSRARQSYPKVYVCEKPDEGLKRALIVTASGKGPLKNLLQNTCYRQATNGGPYRATGCGATY